MSKKSYMALAGITAILGFGSVAGACYIVYGATKLRKSLKNKPSKNNPLFITEHVLWMSVCDILQQSWIAFSWLPLTFDADWNAGWSPAACKITGMFAQFFLVASASWNFVIAISLLRMLNATEIHKFQNEIKYNHIFAWGISLICCIIPWIGDAYGYTKNIELQYGLAEFECWIKEPSYTLCLYLPAAIYVFFAAILLAVTYIKSRAKRIQHSSTSWRLALYTIVFVVTWTFPIILRVHHIVSDSPAATFTVWGHHILVASIGLGNAIIWGTSGSMKRSPGGSENSKSSKTHSTFSTAIKSKMSKLLSKSNVITPVSKGDVTPAPADVDGDVGDISTQKEENHNQPVEIEININNNNDDSDQ